MGPAQQHHDTAGSSTLGQSQPNRGIAPGSTRRTCTRSRTITMAASHALSLIHISEPTRLDVI
eukprot:1132680-Prorocentrum_lima.AAC.1